MPTELANRDVGARHAVPVFESPIGAAGRGMPCPYIVDFA